jgi:hypothetical protein
MSTQIGYTKTFTVGSATPVGVVAVGFSKRIIVGEDSSVSGWPTTDFLVRKSLSTDPARQVPIGSNYVFDRERAWRPGDTVGYVQTVTGTTTFFQDEQAP